MDVLLVVVHLTASVLLRAPPACLSIVTLYLADVCFRVWPQQIEIDRNCKCIT